MPPCEEKTDAVQRQGQGPQKVTGSWSEALWFACLAIGYMIVLGYATNAR